ncbi:ABC transporter G family member 9-like isoform X2 [Papaver somniferum]|uniref:ABC transporter G family member 9-like isoform X2 n=1 Tax=Papaver somniferum TaxID=3469 RepID=UPI000E6FA981|nr:ABC transporter G family member 9-like isoform X2 [Papaver somniferum]
MAESEEQEASIKKLNNHPVVLKFDNVTYKINTKKTGFQIGERTYLKSKLDDNNNETVILKGITGTVQPGEMLAILGPSGCGKTSLLTALGGRLLGGQLCGTITYNGKPYLSNAMYRNTGYVAQDDRFYAHLTVTETLMFTALLRLPNKITKEEKIIRTEEVITQLGLTGCKNSIMGGPFIRGVSGGERKRVSIGQEILTNPSLLLLDEPTSGLDSTSAQQVVSMLRDLASEGHRTVLVSIHQPSSKLFYMFHKILLLSDGNPLYFGRGNETMEYFSSIGYSSPVAVNLCDFLVDLANGVYLGDLNEERRKDVKRNLVLAYKNTILDRLKEEQKLEVDHNNDSSRMDKDIGQWPTTCRQEFSVLLKRDLLERKHESLSIMQVGQMLAVAFLSGMLWWKSSINHIEDQIGFLFAATMYWSLYPMFTAILTFPQERMMLIKEQSSRMYRLSSYFIARNVADLPMELALPSIFVTITYWMVGLKPTVESFLVTLVVMLYNVLVSQGLGLAIGSVIMNPRIGTVFGGIVGQAFLLASGFYIRNVPSFVAWIKL